jgi:hypothetical protein
MRIAEKAVVGWAATARCLEIAENIQLRRHIGTKSDLDERIGDYTNP